jgi:hypothetical protein
MELLHKKSWWALIKIQMILLGVLTLYSCGKGYLEDENTEEEVSVGNYWADLKPLNTRVGRFTGWVSLSISDNQFWARIKVVGPNTKAMHSQYLHVNGRCPQMRDDLNHDGYLDFMESYRIAGPILPPFDSNLNSQMKGLNEFPITRGTSSFYYYSEACNLDRMIEDLRRKDTYSRDMMTKLKGNEDIRFRRRVIIIYGTNDERELPASVQSFGGYPSQATIPIACGEVHEGCSDSFNL